MTHSTSSGQADEGSRQARMTKKRRDDGHSTFKFSRCLFRYSRFGFRILALGDVLGSADLTNAEANQCQSRCSRGSCSHHRESILGQRPTPSAFEAARASGYCFFSWVKITVPVSKS